MRDWNWLVHDSIVPGGERIEMHKVFNGEAHFFIFDVITVQEEDWFYTESSDFGAAVIGGGRTAEEARDDFIQGFFALIDLHAERGTLSKFMDSIEVY